jgi:hypothetical protein
VLVGEQQLERLVRQNGGEEYAGDIGRQQAVTALGENDGYQHWIVDAKPNESADQQVAMHLLH